MSLNTALVSDAAPPRPRATAPHPVIRLVVQRVALGVLTLWVVSVIIFAATVALPGNAATAILGHSATPAQLHALEVQLRLNRSVFPKTSGTLSTTKTNRSSFFIRLCPSIG